MPDRRGTVAERFVGERIAGRFVIDRLIGEGSISSAFRARDELLKRRVTVKLFHPVHPDDVAVIDSQLELAKAVARLSHEHIALVIDRGEHDGMPFLVLEFVAGESLAERMERFAPLPAREVVAYGTSIARALAYAHAQGVVHGNLRPGNVLLDEDREAKLVDFGRGSFVVQLTGDPYAPPEEVLDPNYVPSPEADVFALGAILFAALTDSRPVADVDEVRVQMLRPDASAQLAGVLARALASDPSRRTATMREFAADLASLHGTLPTGAREPAARPAQMRGAGPELPPTIEVGAQPIEQLDPLAPPRAAHEHGGARHRTRRRDIQREREGIYDVEREGHRGSDIVRLNARQRRGRIVVWSFVLVPLVIVVVVALMLAGEHGHGQRVAKSHATQATGPLQPAQIQQIVSYDPEGDGSENEDMLGNLTDGDTTTWWQTQGYGSTDFAGLKHGVGFYVTLAAPAQLRQAVLYTNLPGWTLQIYAADQPGTSIADWVAVSQPVDVASGATIAVTPKRSYANYLFWVTKLSLDPLDPANFRARIDEMRLKTLVS